MVPEEAYQIPALYLKPKMLQRFLVWVFPLQEAPFLTTTKAFGNMGL